MATVGGQRRRATGRAPTRHSAANPDQQPDDLDAPRQLALIHRIAESLAHTSTTSEVLAAVVGTLESELGATAVAISVSSDQGDTLDTLASAGLSAKATEFVNQPVALDSEVPAWGALKRGEPLFWSSLADRDEDFPAFSEFPSQHQSWAILPLGARGESFGVLSIGWREAREFTPGASALLEVIAHECAIALDRARLLDAVQQERSALELLAEGTRLMVSALEPSEVVRALVRLAVPRLAPWCAVYVADGGVLRRVAIEIAGRSTLASRLRGVDAVNVDSDQPLAVAYRTGQLQIVPEIKPNMVEEVYGPDGTDTIMGGSAGDERGWTALVVPVQVSGQVIGVMSLVSRRLGPALPDQVRFAAEGLAARAGIALANAGRFQEEHETVVMLTRALMPAALPPIDGYQLAARYLPSGGTVAGDWFDAIRLMSGSYLVGVGDAAGHGFRSAATMALLRNAARGLAFADLPPDRILHQLSAVLCESEPEGFATALYGLLEPSVGTFTWAAAGHLPFVHYGADSARLVQVGGAPPLGWPPDGTPVPSETLQLQAGDGIVLFTDGLVERRGAELGDRLETLRRLVERHRELSAERLADRIVDVLCALPADDCSVIVLRRAGGGPARSS